MKLNKDFEKEANRAYLLSLISYLNIGSIVNNKTYEPVAKVSEYEETSRILLRDESKIHPFEVNKTIRELFCNTEYEGHDTHTIFDEVKQIIEKHPEYLDIELITTSRCTPGFLKETLECSVFNDNGHIVFAYRGTGAGKWMDNAQGLYQDSQMQVEAVKYFEQLSEIYARNKPVTVTGHSKGGNLAQAAWMLSKNTSVDAVFSFDGQGFSNSRVEALMSELGSEKYEDKISKMYQICAKNDPVNTLGRVIIKPENTIRVEEREKVNPHDLRALSLEGTGSISFFRGEKSEIESTSMGTIAILAKNISERVMKQDNKILASLCLASMGIAQAVTQNELGLLSHKDKNQKIKGLLSLVNKNTFGYRDAEALKVYGGTGTIKRPSSLDLKRFKEIGIPLILDEIKCSVSRGEVLESDIKNLIPDNPLAKAIGSVIEDSIKRNDPSYAQTLFSTLLKVTKMIDKVVPEYSEYTTFDTLRRFEKFRESSMNLLESIDRMPVKEEKKVELYFNEFIKQIRAQLQQEKNEKVVVQNDKDIVLH